MESKTFLNFWGWKSHPWEHRAPLNKLFWQNETYDLLRRTQIYLSFPGSISILTAPSGHGKTTLAHWFYENLAPQSHDILFVPILQSPQSAEWLSPWLAKFLGQTDRAAEGLNSLLPELLTSQTHQRIVTLLIDDAHKLETKEAVSDIGILMKLQTALNLPLNVALIGEPSVVQRLTQDGGLRSRINTTMHIPPLSPIDARKFILYFLESLALDPKTIRDDALQILMGSAARSFRDVEHTVQTCLIEGFLRGQKIITADLAAAALSRVVSLKTVEQNIPHDIQARPELRKAANNAATSRSHPVIIEQNPSIIKKLVAMTRTIPKQDSKLKLENEALRAQIDLKKKSSAV